MSVRAERGRGGDQTPFIQQSSYNCFPIRFAPLLQKRATSDDPSRVIVTASVAGLGVGMLGEMATFGYSASKGTSPLLC